MGPKRSAKLQPARVVDLSAHYVVAAVLESISFAECMHGAELVPALQAGDTVSAACNSLRH